MKPGVLGCHLLKQQDSSGKKIRERQQRNERENQERSNTRKLKKHTLIRHTYTRYIHRRNRPLKHPGCTQFSKPIFPIGGGLFWPTDAVPLEGSRRDGSKRNTVLLSDLTLRDYTHSIRTHLADETDGDVEERVTAQVSAGLHHRTELLDLLGIDQSAHQHQDQRVKRSSEVAKQRGEKKQQ